MAKPSKIIWMPAAKESFDQLKEDALRIRKSREKKKRGKSSKQEGLFKQVYKTIGFLEIDLRHPSLHNHDYSGIIENPYKKGKKVFGAYAQNKTPSAYRVFWCYGPKKGEISILAITPHP